MVYKPKREFEILDEGYKGCFHYCIVSFGTHPCAYVELPKEHKYYGKSYEDIDGISCHGGITYISKNGIFSEDNELHKDGFWIGWDYAHYDDFSGYELSFSDSYITDGKKWSTEEIFQHVEDVITQLILIGKV